MGLDQYLIASFDPNIPGHREPDDDNLVDQLLSEGVTVFEWQKHARLNGWMERLWRMKHRQGPFYPNTYLEREEVDGKSTFDGQFLKLELYDLNWLEDDVDNNRLIFCTGFFWGNNYDAYSYFEAIGRAKRMVSRGYTIYYYCNW